MRIKLFIIGLILQTSLNAQVILNLLSNKRFVKADIYVAYDGNDTDEGTFQKPIKTISKLNTLLANNKIIAFKSGGEYEGKINISSKIGITLESYGKGIAPIFTTKKQLTGSWSHSGNLWSYQDDNFPAEITNVFQNENQLTLGRFPKSGNLPRYTSRSNFTIKDENNIYPNGKWNGGQIVAYILQWVNQTSRITSYTDSVFTVVDSIGFYEGNPRSTWGYFIQNHVDCLTSEGEWAFNPSTKTLTVYSSSQPQNILVTYNDDCLNIQDSYNITVKGISFQKSNRDLIHIANSADIIIDRNLFNYSGANAIYAERCHNLTITNNTSDNIAKNFIDFPFYQSQSPMVYMPISTGITIQGNKANSQGMTLGKQNLLPDKQTEGENIGQLNGIGILLCNAYDVVIKENEIKNSGYSGICIVRSGNYEIVNNWIDNSCHWLTDGGAIYTVTCTNTIAQSVGQTTSQGLIHDNILTNCGSQNILIGLASDYTYGGSNGIYIDFDSYNQKIYNNFISNPTYGIFANWTNNDYYDNVIYNPYKYGYILANQQNDSLRFLRNTVVLDSISGEIGQIYPFYNKYSVRYSKYYTPFSQTILFEVPGFFTSGTFAQWKSDESRVVYGRNTEVLSIPSIWNLSKPKKNFIYPIYNNSKNNLIINQSYLPYTDYLFLDGSNPSYPITIQPYKSLILVRKEN